MMASPSRPAGLPGSCLRPWAWPSCRPRWSCPWRWSPSTAGRFGGPGAALFVAGQSLRRGAGQFALLGFFFLTGGAAQLYMTEPLWFPRCT